MAAFQGPKLGAALCEALGLDASKVADISISVPVGEVPKVTVTYLIREGEGVVELIKQYVLHDPIEGE